MYWLRRPAPLRGILAALLLAGAAYLDLSGPATSSHPFAGSVIGAGTPIADAAVEWRDVPRGLLPLPDLAGAVADHDLQPGDPLLPSSVGAAPAVPAGWWAVTLALPVGATPGSPIRAVLHGGSEVVEGMVVEPSSLDDYEAAGVAAFPGDAAIRVAAAAATSAVVVLVVP